MERLATPLPEDGLQLVDKLVQHRVRTATTEDPVDSGLLGYARQTRGCCR